MKASPSTSHPPAESAGHHHHAHAPTVPSGGEPAPDAPVYMGLPAARVLLPRFWVALALSAPVLVLAMGAMLAPHAFHWLSPRTSGWLQLALTTPVFFWSGWFFIRRWWKSLRERDPNMFTLTVTGTGAAYFYSCARAGDGQRKHVG